MPKYSFDSHMHPEKGLSEETSDKRTSRLWTCMVTQRPTRVILWRLSLSESPQHSIFITLTMELLERNLLFVLRKMSLIFIASVRFDSVRVRKSIVIIVGYLKLTDIGSVARKHFDIIRSKLRDFHS